MLPVQFFFFFFFTFCKQVLKTNGDKIHKGSNVEESSSCHVQHSSVKWQHAKRIEKQNVFLTRKKKQIFYFA